MNGPLFASVISARIFRQCSIFLKELTNDNTYAKVLHSEEFNIFIQGTASSSLQVNPDNVDFYWNLLELHFNVILQKEGLVGIQQRFSFYKSKIEELLVSNPTEYFMTNFL